MKRLVAVEVTDDYVRGVEIEAPLTNKPKLTKFGEVELPRGVANESEIFDVDAVSDALKDLWKQEKFGTKTVALGLGGRKILVRDHDAALNDLATIKKNLSFDAANILPQAMGNAILDFYPTGITKSDTDMDMVNGLLVATPLESAEKIVAALTGADLDVQFVDYLPFALARSARKAFGGKDEYMLVNVKSYSTDIIALKQGVPQMVRVIPNGLIVRDNKGGKHRGVADSSASFSGEVAVQTDPIDSLIKGIGNTISLYTNKGGAPRAVLLTGEGSVSEELKERLPQGLQMGLGVLNLENVVQLPKNPKTAIERAAALGLIGIAMRGLK